MTLDDSDWQRVRNALTRADAALDGLRAQAAKLRGVQDKLRRDGLDDLANAVIAAASAVEIRVDRLRAALVELGARTDPTLEQTQPIGLPLPPEPDP